MEVFKLLSHVAHHFFDRLRPHVIYQLGLHCLWSFIEKVTSQPVAFLSFRSARALFLLVDEADVDQAALAEECD